MGRKANYIVLTVFFVLYGATWLPYFDVMNDLGFIGPFPQAMAWVLGINVVNTVLVIVVYFKFFKAYADRMDGPDEEIADPQREEVPR